MYGAVDTSKVKVVGKRGSVATKQRKSVIGLRSRIETMPDDIKTARETIIKSTSSKNLKAKDGNLKKRISVIKRGTAASAAADVANDKSRLSNKRVTTPKPFAPAGNDHRRGSITSCGAITIGDLFH